MWLTDLSRLAEKKYGLRVVFEDGWRTRGASRGQAMKGALGVLWHHTAGPRTGNYPSRNVLLHGRPGLTGPLCHIGLRRDGTVVVVGAGKANHAGTGKVDGVVRNGGNTRLVGIEAESSGVKRNGEWDWSDDQLETMPLLGAALNDIFDLTSAKHWGHLEYSDGGKIDPAGLPGGMRGLRARIAAVRIGSAVIPKVDPTRPWATSARVAALSSTAVKSLQTRLVAAGYSVGSYGIDGSYGDATGHAVKQFQQDLGLTADGIYGPDTEDTMAKIDDVIKQLGTIKTDIGKIPARVLDEPITLQGSDKGKRSSLRTRTAWTNHEQQRAITAIAGLNARVSGLEKALEGALAGGTVDLEAVKAAAAEGARQGGVSVSAEDVARVLDVTVSEAS